MDSRGLRVRGAIALVCALAGLAWLAGCDSSNPAKPTPVCSYTLNPQNQAFSSDGGAGAVAIATDASCEWSVEGASEWVALSSPSHGTGPGTVTYTILPNADAAAREKTLTVATRPYRISQEGRQPCAYSIAPEQQAVGDEGGTGEVQVTAGAGCAWSATSTVAWLAVTDGGSGRGPGLVKYRVDPNNGADARTGTLAIATRTLTVSQEGEGSSQPANCTYAVSPVLFSPCMPAGRVTATVTTEPRCQWTVSAGASWLSVASSSTGAGPGSVTIAFPDNYDAPRDGIVMVRWPTPTAGQNVRVEQAGCTYSVTPSSVSIAAAGGSASFDVVQESQPNTCGGPLQDRCVWTAQSNVGWITITSSMPRTGDNPVAFTVAANTGAARTGRITVRDKVVTITQAAP
jgi:all-beta uncharacterized protein/BACON domain-containing protein